MNSFPGKWHAVMLLVFLLAGCLSLKSIGKTQRSAGTRVAPADNPLNMVETPGEFLVSTNAAYESPYLLSFNERGRKISGRLNLPSLWYGLDYDASRKLLRASAGTHSVFAVPFSRGVFGKPREIILKSCDQRLGKYFREQQTLCCGIVSQAKASYGLSNIVSTTCLYHRRLFLSLRNVNFSG